MKLTNLMPQVVDERRVDLRLPDWIWELKYDGIRMLAKFGHGTCELQTRQGVRATTWYTELSRALAQVKGGPFITDGEVCVLDELGRTDFEAVMDRTRKKRRLPGAPAVTYCMFDLLAVGDANLMEHPLLERKARLVRCFTPPPDRVLVVGHFDADATELWQAVKQLKLEGLVAKRADSIYQPGVQSPDWVKVKCKAPSRLRG